MQFVRRQNNETPAQSSEERTERKTDSAHLTPPLPDRKLL